MPNKKNINKFDLPRLLGCESATIPERCIELLARSDLHYKILDHQERENVILRVLETLNMPIEASGPHRKERWEQGWAENLSEFEASGYNPGTLIPKFIKNDIKRLDGNYIQPESSSFELDLVQILWQYLFRSFFAEASAVYEFGCGPGQNLITLSEIFPDKPLVGLDWAQSSLEIVKRLKSELGINVEAQKFDFFQPDIDYTLADGCAVFTAGALEQVGRQFESFLRWQLQQPFSICINVETLHEVYNPNNLFDYLARWYVEKRNYLQGYLKALRNLETEGKIKILKVQRVFGSLFNDVYSYVVWMKG